MRKRGLVVLVVLAVILIAFSIVSADDNSTNSTTNTNSAVTTNVVINTTGIDKAYQCLSDLVSGNNQLSFQEAVFSALALGSKTEISNAIENQKGTNCWPESGCVIKDSAQGLLAYNAMGKNTGDIATWLMQRNGSATDLQWFLQIDISSHTPGSCDISYDGSKKGSVNVNDDMTLSTGGVGSCLTLSSSRYWLMISNDCLDKEFQVSCNQDFITNLIYKKNTGNTIYVMSKTDSAASSGTTTEKVNAQCFKNNNVCDYEGTLWAALALSKTGKSVTSFVPYLVALADDNSKFFPSAFIYILNGGQDQYDNIVQSQQQSRYWEMTATPNNKFFDTALGMLGLASTSAQEKANAMNYLLSIQTTKGCWNNDNIRDTGFLLYAGWPRQTSSSPDTGTTLCTANAGYACTSSGACIDGGGRVLYEFECPGATDYCCNIVPEVKHCTTGAVCTAGNVCSGTEEATAEGSCCTGTCQPATVPNTCESNNAGTCKVSCDPNIEDTITSSSCGDTRACCAVKAPTSSGSLLWLWIILLIILIALIVLAIIYRDKLRMWWFKFRGRAKTSTINRPSPPGSGGQMQRFTPPRFAPAGFIPGPRPMQRQMPARRSPRDTEMDETFKKLREMGK